MKKILIIFLAAFSFNMMQSCKKGENDPFLSLKTRDARVTGEWSLTYANETYLYKEEYQGNTYEESETLIFESGLAQESEGYSYTIDGVTQSDSYNDDPYSFEETLTIEKNGDYSISSKSDNTMSSNSSNWYWFDTAKKKTQLVIGGSVFNVDRLTNKELVIKAQEFEQVKYNEDGEQYLESYSIERRYVKK